MKNKLNIQLSEYTNRRKIDKMYLRDMEVTTKVTNRTAMRS